MSYTFKNQINRTVISTVFILWFSFFWCQNIDNVGEIKLEINELVINNEILEVNKIIKKNTFLDVEYRLSILNKNLILAKERNVPEELEDTYFSLGNFWHTQDNKIKAFDYYLKCDSIAKKNNHFLLEGMALMNRSSLLDDNSLRIKMTLKAVTAFQKTNDTLNLAKAHLNTGVAYSIFFNSIKLIDSINNPQLKEDITYFKKNMFKHYAIADSLGESIKSNEIRAAVTIYYAEWYDYIGQLKLGKTFFNKGRNFSKQSGFLKGEVYCILQTAYINRKLGNTNEMFQNLTIVEEISTKNKYKDYLKQVYQVYVSIYSKNNEYDKALKYQQLLTQIKLDLLNSGNQDKLRILGLQNELSENGYQLEKVESQQQINKLIMILSIIVSLFIASMAYLALKNKKKKITLIQNNATITKLEKIAVETELKNNRLEEELLKEKVRFGQDHLMKFASQVVKIEDFLTLLKTKIKQLNYDNENRSIINELKISFSEVVRGQNHLKQLNSYTTQLNQEFFFYINKNFENITKDDELLLAYVILNMDSKEIGRILNIATDSVFKKRYRLRKKLKLEKNISLIDFYDKIITDIDKTRLNNMF